MRIRRITRTFLFKNSAPNSSSAAEAVTSLIMAHVMTILPFNWVGSTFHGIFQGQKYPPARIFPFPVDMQLASECAFSIISDE